MRPVYHIRPHNIGGCPGQERQMTENTIQFESHDELDAWLQRLPEYAQWGVGKAKSSEDLWAELQAGETQLTVCGKRHVRVVTGWIRRSAEDQRILLELSQQLGDGRTRSRKRPMGEKIQGEETPLKTLYRGLQEELQLTATEIEFLKSDPYHHVEERTSNSYPGLRSIYDLYRYEVLCRTLPDHDFTVVESCGSRSATWGWRPQPQGH